MRDVLEGKMNLDCMIRIIAFHARITHFTALSINQRTGASKGI